MLVEPPGPVLPPRAGLTISADRLRTAAAAAALVLAVTSRGDALGLAVLLAVVAWRPVAAAAVGLALVATSWRWGSTSLEAIAGAQTVLGPAGVVEPTSAAAASWLAAGAIVLAAAPHGLQVGGTSARQPRVDASNLGTASGDRHVGVRSERPGRAGAPNLLGSLASVLRAGASGAAAAVVVAGPAPGGDVWVRVLAGVVGAALASGVGALRGRDGRLPWMADGLALVAGLGALVAVAPEAPTWSGTVDAEAVGYGAATAIAVSVLVVAAGTAATMGRRQP